MADPKVIRLATAIAEALSALVDLAKDGEPILHTAGAEAEEALPEPKKRGPKPKSDAQPAETAPQDKSASAGAASSASAEETSSTTVEEKPEPEAETAPTLDDARKLAVDLAKAKGRAGLLDILTQFGAAGVSALKPEHIADFCDACRESLAA